MSVRMSVIRWIALGTEIAVSILTIFMWRSIRPYYDAMTVGYSDAAIGSADIGEGVTALAIIAFWVVVSVVLAIIFMASGPKESRPEVC